MLNSNDGILPVTNIEGRCLASPNRPIKCTVVFIICIFAYRVLFKISTSSILESRTARRGRFPWEVGEKASINTQLVRI